MATQYMGLTLPVVSSTIGPSWAQLLNAALTTLDSHTHVSGQGQLIPTAALSINADLSLNSFNATLLRSARFVNNSSALALNTDAGCVFVAGGDLYYRSVSAQTVQITSGAALSASSLGGISGLAAPASVAFSSSTATFTWRSNTNVAAILDGGPLIIRDVAASALGITLASPTSLGAGYTITLPSAVPGATVLLQMSSGGVLTPSNTITGTIANATSTPVSITPDTGIAAQGGLAYYKDATNHVHLRGAMFNTTGLAAPNLVTTNPLPAGFRPSTTREFACNQGPNFYGISIVNTGTIVTSSGAGIPSLGTVFVDGITFLAEA